MSNEVYAPNVHLFAYHFKDNENPDLLYQKCDEILKKLKIENFNLNQRVALNKEPGRKVVDLLNDEEINKNNNPSPPFAGKFLLEDKPIKFEGFAYPLRIHDSYALALNIRRPEKDENLQKTEDVDIALLKQFNPDNCLLSDFIASSLGQTILITAWIPEAERQQYCDSWQLPEELQEPTEIFLRELANECVDNFISDYQKRPQLYRKGQLFGSPIFEYGILDQNTNYKHILVWFFCTEATDNKFGNCYHELIDLFGYRNKIFQTYRDSRHVSQVIDEKYKYIEKEIDKFEQLDKSSLLSEANLKQLQTQLKNLAKTASEYARWLRDLEEQQHTIAINTRNYTEKLREIRNKIEHEYSSWLGNDLSFLESFRKNCRHFQEQIQADLGYYVPGSGLLDQAIASIRGIVEIDQAECDRILQEQLRNNELAEARRDRNLETILAVAGVGLAVTEIVGSSTPYLILQDTPKPIQPPFTSDTLHPFTLSLLLSLVCGVAAAGITWVLIRQRHSDNQVK